VQVLGFAVIPNQQVSEPEKKAVAAKPPWQRMLQGEDAKKADAQENKLAELQEAGKFAEALKVAESLAELRAKVQGADHWQVVDARSEVGAIRSVLRAMKEEQQNYGRALTMQHKASTLAAQGRYREAHSLLEQVVAILRKMLGEEHPETAKIYNNLASNLDAQGKHKEAEEGYRKALAIQRKVLGEEHPDTAASYNNLAFNLNAQGKYQEAEEGFRKALAICRKLLGEEDPHTAMSYNNVAGNLNDQGKYPEAEEGFRKALVVRRQVLGEEHPETAMSYSNVALNLDALGKHKEAEKDYRKALAIFRKVLGDEHPHTAKVYSNLAHNLNAQGKYQEAEEGYRKALAIQRQVLGEEHPETAKSYNNVALNLNAQGKYQEAEEGLRKALAIQRKVLGEEHPDTAISFNNVALNLYAQGKYKEAEEENRKALVIWRKVLGEKHPHTALGYNNLASNLKAQGKYHEAEEGLRKALAIRRQVLGEEHPETAISYNNVALNLNAQGKYKEAEEGLRKALAIRRQVLGEEHLDTVKSYNSVALNLSAQGRYAESEIFFLRAAESFAKARLHIAATGLERAAKASEESSLPRLAALLARNGKPDDAWERFEESLARGTWDDLTARLRRPQSERDRQAQIIGRIDRLNKLIERASVSKPTPEQSKQREELLGQLREAYDELAAYTQQLEKSYGPIGGQVFSRTEIQASLHADAALIAWLDIAGQPNAKDPNGEHWAILLRSAGDPIWVRLSGSGDSNAWTDADTRLPVRLREALQSPRGLWHPLAERLRTQRLEPLAHHLKGLRRLIVLPSAALAGLPLEVIADGFTVSYALSGTMYAHLLQQPAPTGKALLVLANPDFQTTPVAKKPLPLRGVLVTMVLPGSNAAKAGLKPNDVLLHYGDVDLNGPADIKPQPESSDPEKTIPVIVWRDGQERKRPLFVRPGKLGVVFASAPAPQALAEQHRLDRVLDSTRGGGDWKELPGTRVEAAALRRLFGASARVLERSEASEQRLNELAASGELGQYRYIHLATHGEVNDVFPLRSAVILARDHLPDEKQRTDLLTAGQPIPDGRLEADEALSRWNLHSDLVTLSACQTALGKYEHGEGFVGFAQALVLCGTRSVCLSLWKVNDTATALLMERFYQNLLGKREGLNTPLSKASALAEAKQWLRTLPRQEAEKRAAFLSAGMERSKTPNALSSEAVLMPAPVAASKDDLPFAHPYYWAAFVLVGSTE
jgi:tetratricopeptide (TPR) repeat protein